MKVLKPFETELKEYCKENNLNFSKVDSSPKCGNKSILFIQYVDFSKPIEGITNEEPAEILLTVIKNNDGTVSIEKGANADKYLHL